MLTTPETVSSTSGTFPPTYLPTYLPTNQLQGQGASRPAEVVEEEHGGVPDRSQGWRPFQPSLQVIIVFVVIVIVFIIVSVFTDFTFIVVVIIILVIWLLSSISSSYVVVVFIILVMVAVTDLITTRVQVQKETEDGMEDGVCGEVFNQIHEDEGFDDGGRKLRSREIDKTWVTPASTIMITMIDKC